VNKFKLALAASLVAVAGSSMAADGTLGATSTGTSTVTIIKDNAVQITSVGDLNMLTHSTLAADMTANDDVCVFSSTGGYNITVTSDTGSFDLSGTGATPASLPFGFTWETVATGVQAIPYGTPLAGLAGDNTSLNCGGGTNAEFEATIAAVDFNAIVPDTYSATVSIEVAPE